MTQSSGLTRRLINLPRAGWHSGKPLWRGLAGLLLLTLLWWGYTQTGQPVTLLINGQPHTVRTHHLQVETIISELGLQLAAEDIVSPPLQATLSPGQKITVQLARPVVIDADNRTWQLRTHHPTIAAILEELNISLHPRDEISVNGQLIDPAATLPPRRMLAAETAIYQLLAVTTPEGSVAAGRPEPVQLVIHRATPVTLWDGVARSRFYSARATVGEALLEQGLTIYLGDRVTPSLGTPLQPGMRVYIERSMPVTINADNRRIDTRTHQQTVGDILAQAGIPLVGQDYTEPPLTAQVSANDSINIVRVQETLEVEEDFIEFETQWIADDSLELDQQEVRQPGNTGVIKTRHRVRYENGRQVARTLEDEWLAQTPSERVIAYGTQVVVRTLETAEGPVEYWRRISMRATAYSAATSGKAPSHPLYGITRSGLPAGKGVVAVDPRVLPLRTKLYIEDYGPAVAGDTGGRILGKHIDLGYPDDEPLPVIFEWRDVYVLTPAPPSGRIRYVLPQWPQR